MTPEETEECKALYREVQYLSISPAEADARLLKLGAEPFQRRPDQLRFDPMTEAEWTLPMAAAWFIWRSIDAVRDQWNPAREGWRKWVPRTPPLRPRGLIVPRRSAPQPSMILVNFGRANLADVFSQAGLPSVSSRNSSSASARSPYGRLKEALVSGQLLATRGRSSSEHAEKILREYWQGQFDAKATGKERNPLYPSALNRFSTLNQKLVSATTKHNDTEIPMKDDFDKLLQEIDSDLEANIDNFEAWKKEQNKLNADMTEFFIARDDIIRVEQEISKREYEVADWDIGQTLGWIAYRNQDGFRSLWETDLNPRPKYCGEVYSPDFVTSDPAGPLKEKLLSGELKGYQKSEPIPLAGWIGSEVWNYPDTRFMRADVIKVWKVISLVALPKKPPPSMVKLIEIYRNLHVELGYVPTEKEFRNRIESLGLQVSVLLARRACKKYCDDNNLEREVGPRRRPRKLFPDPRGC